MLKFASIYGTPQPPWVPTVPVTSTGHDVADESSAEAAVEPSTQDDSALHNQNGVELLPEANVLTQRDESPADGVCRTSRLSCSRLIRILRDCLQRSCLTATCHSGSHFARHDSAKHWALTPRAP